VAFGLVVCGIVTGMSPKQIVESVLYERFEDEDGDAFSVQLHPGLSESEYRDFVARLPAPPPDDIRELLLFTRGFDFNPVEKVDLRGELEFEYEPAFPHGLPICGDGFGNFWVVDVNPESGAWAPIFYACHDPPVIAWQAQSLGEFLNGLFELGRRNATSAVGHVHDSVVFEIWKRNPGLVPVPEARGSDDRELRTFAEQLDERALIADLRDTRIGSGFSWGRYGPDTLVQRDGPPLLFAITPPGGKSLLQRLFGQ
jgi:SMI1/KNR4 family protein SUKH-1